MVDLSESLGQSCSGAGEMDEDKLLSKCTGLITAEGIDEEVLDNEDVLCSIIT